MVSLPKNTFQKIGTVLGIVLFFFGLWQMDVICIPRIWNEPPMYGWLPPSQNQLPYEMGRVGNWKLVMSTGTGYDLMQAFMVVGFLLVLLCLWFWDD